MCERWDTWTPDAARCGAGLAATGRIRARPQRTGEGGSMKRQVTGALLARRARSPSPLRRPFPRPRRPAAARRPAAPPKAAQRCSVLARGHPVALDRARIAEHKVEHASVADARPTAYTQTPGSQGGRPFGVGTQNCSFGAARRQHSELGPPSTTAARRALSLSHPITQRDAICQPWPRFGTA
jgi:hypothetical protein